MPTFYRQRGHFSPAVLWNPAKNSSWYEFVDGQFSTDEPEVIAKLREMGFSDTPMDVKTQTALAITADLMAPQPAPPPDYRKVPAVEPKPKMEAHAAVAKAPKVEAPTPVAETAPAKTEPVELGKKIPIARAPKAKK